MKMMSDSPECSLEVALAWSINAKNSLHNVYGFSPSQLVFGRNLNIPSILTDKLPALSRRTQSEEVARLLNAMHDARKAFIESEASEKIRRALRHNVREAITMVFEPGNKVYYKIIGSDYWRGPATVIGKDSHQVILKHGGLFVRVHPVSLRKIEEEPHSQSVVVEQRQIHHGSKTTIPSQSGKVWTFQENNDDDGEDDEEQELTIWANEDHGNSMSGEASGAPDNNLMSFDEGIMLDEQNVSLPIEEINSESLMEGIAGGEESDSSLSGCAPNPTSTPIRNGGEVKTDSTP